MGKTSKQSLKNSANTSINPATKVKRTRKSVPRDSPPQRSSIYRGVTRFNHILFSLKFFYLISYSVQDSFLYMIALGIDGPDVMRLICGIRTAGMSHRTRKEDKVIHLLSPTLPPFSRFPSSPPNLSSSLSPLYC